MQVAPYDEDVKATLPNVAADDHANGLATNLNNGSMRERNGSLTSPSHATGSTNSTAGEHGTRVKPKQKRNKPTLSCLGQSIRNINEAPSSCALPTSF